MGIGSKLDLLIKRRGRNVNDVAKAASVPASTVYSIIKRDNTKADLDDLQRLAKELGVTLEYFVDTYEPETIAAHYDSEDWTEEDLAEIEKFKKYVKSNMLSVYENIKSRREFLGLSQEQLAERTGYTSRSSIAKIEKGLVDLPISKIIIFAEALETTPSELMGDTWEEWTDEELAEIEEFKKYVMSKRKRG